MTSDSLMIPHECDEERWPGESLENALQISLPPAALAPFSSYAVHVHSSTGTEERSLSTTNWETFRNSGDAEIHRRVQIGGLMEQSISSTVVTTLASDETQLVVRLGIPTATPGFRYLDAELSAQVVEFNSSSPNEGYVVATHTFDLTKPQDGERTLTWGSPKITQVHPNSSIRGQWMNRREGCGIV